ncbi:uncharacterized protein LOC134264549 [Saccostrea cucullata]|uniref:uncharacterized protein LOC134264549 n=1 Tax=Saccostrea cuccullata TaxID=36930 RepID=UPI002ED3541F
MESDNDDDITLCALAKKIQEQNTVIDDDDDNVPLINIVLQKTKNISYNIETTELEDNVPLINIRNKIKCSDIINSNTDENISKENENKRESIKQKTSLDRNPKQAKDQEGSQKTKDHIGLRSIEEQDKLSMEEGQKTLQETEGQMRLQMEEDREKLQRVEDQQVVRRTEDQSMSKSAEDQQVVQRAEYQGMSKSAEDQQVVQRVEYQSMSKSAEDQQVVQRAEYQSMSKSAEDQQVVQRVEYQSMSKSAEDQQVVQRVEYQGMSKSAEDQQVVQRAEDQSMSKRVVDQQVVQRAEDQGMPKRVVDQQVVQRAEDQGMSKSAEDQQLVQRAEDQDMSKRVGDQQVVQREDDQSMSRRAEKQGSLQSANDKNNNICEQEVCDATGTFAVSNEGSTSIDVLMPLFESDINFDFPEVEDQFVYEICSTSYETPEIEVNSTPKESFNSTDTSTTQEDTDTEISEEVTESEEEIVLRQSRRRKKNVEKWKQTIRKRRRNAGESYVSSEGKNVSKKTMKQISCKCKFKCSQNFNEEDQRLIFTKFWQLNYEKQRSYIKENVIKTDKRRRTTMTESRRKKTLQYFFTDRGENRVQVCKKTFLCTLGLGERTVQYTLGRQEKNGMADRRGRKKGYSKFTQEDKEYIREHIRSFPTVSSHYCRKNTQRRYLSKDLSISKMYELYREKCSEDGMVPKKFWLYDRIFGEEFNLGFHKPKKDLCTICEAYKLLPDSEKEASSEEHKKHLKRKENARAQKQADKLRANDQVMVLNFDLQKVLITPQIFVSDAYYSRKLATYNFTIYDMNSKSVVCNIWNETDAKRGSCEIATCLFLFNKSVGPKEEIVYFSDSCTGQQRNLQFSTMCLYTVVNLPINVLTHYYFERGHSQMEGDSVHATIECATKKSEIFTTSDWITAIKNAKRKDPKYQVKELGNEMVLDFKECAQKVVSCNRRKDSTGENVHWNKIHVFQYKKENPDTIYFKYEFDDEFRAMPLQGRKRKSKVDCMQLHQYPLKPLYTHRIPISEAKYKDLQTLCQRGLIPRAHQDFFKALPHEGDTDALPEPNGSDESDIDN